MTDELRVPFILPLLSESQVNDLIIMLERLPESIKLKIIIETANLSQTYQEEIDNTPSRSVKKFMKVYREFLVDWLMTRPDLGKKGRWIPGVVECEDGKEEKRFIYYPGKEEFKKDDQIVVMSIIDLVETCKEYYDDLEIDQEIADLILKHTL